MSIYAQRKNEYIEYISRCLTKKRFAHSLGTAETAVELAKRFGEDAEKAEAAAILHDAGKYYPDKLKWAKENGIKKVRLNSGFSRKDAHIFYRSIGYNNEKEQIRFMKEL